MSLSLTLSLSLSLSHTHTQKRKTHSGQKKFEESAEWFQQQPDPLSDSHCPLSESTHTHQSVETSVIVFMWSNQIFYSLIITSDVYWKCDLFSFSFFFSPLTPSSLCSFHCNFLMAGYIVPPFFSCGSCTCQLFYWRTNFPPVGLRTQINGVILKKPTKQAAVLENSKEKILSQTFPSNSVRNTI